MLDFRINIRKNKVTTIRRQQSVSVEDDIFIKQKEQIAIEKYNALVKQLKKKENLEFITEKTKKKDTIRHWEFGKIIVDFIVDMNKQGIRISNLQKALSKSIGGNEEYWTWHSKFYAINPDKKYVKYPWWVCRELALTNHPKTREIIIRGYDAGKIKDQNILNLWKDLIVKKKPRTLSPSRKKIISALTRKDGTDEEIAKRTGLSKDSVRGRISELQGIHGYKITIEDGKYHLHPKVVKKVFTTEIKQDIEMIKQQMKKQGWSW